MSSSRIPTKLRAFVIARADHKCEYCQLEDVFCFYSFHIDHIISEKHGGSSDNMNLAYACPRCNNRKGSDIATISVESGEIIRLFNPRTDLFEEHFTFSGPEMTGLTDLGKSTIKLLQLNSPERKFERSIG